ncbi:MAG: YIP1 family protein [Pyrinomonadaceae bacterium]|nr:YIP1 family protein [Pyrinomonadaceae bacterium]
MSDSSVESFQPSTPPPTPPNTSPPASAVQAPRPVHLRKPAIALFVLGILILIGGIAKFIPGGPATGGAFAFWGVLLFALSFIRLPQPTAADEPPMSGVQKVLGIFYEPTRVFKNLRAHPHWLAALLVIGGVNALYFAAFTQRLTPEVIVNYTFDKLADSPIKPPADQMEAAKEQALQQAKQPIQRVQTAAKTFVGIFAFICFVAAICLLGVLAFGGRINFWQALAATLYAALPVAVISKLLSLVILYIKAPEDIHPILAQETLVTDNLGILFAPAEHPALFVLGSVIGVLSFYGLWLRAKGLANAGQKVSSSAAWGVSITLFVLALIFGMIFATLFSSFIS